MGLPTGSRPPAPAARPCCCKPRAAPAPEAAQAPHMGPPCLQQPANPPAGRRAPSRPGPTRLWCPAAPPHVSRALEVVRLIPTASGHFSPALQSCTPGERLGCCGHANIFAGATNSASGRVPQSCWPLPSSSPAPCSAPTHLQRPPPRPARRIHGREAMRDAPGRALPAPPPLNPRQPLGAGGRRVGQPMAAPAGWASPTHCPWLPCARARLHSLVMPLGGRPGGSSACGAGHAQGVTGLRRSVTDGWQVDWGTQVSGSETLR